MPAWKQIILSMSSRHETSSAWHGGRECSRMRRMKMGGGALIFPGGLHSTFWITVILSCHFRTWSFLGYSLKRPTPSPSQPTPPKGTVRAASPNWCPPQGQVTVSVHILYSVSGDSNTNGPDDNRWLFSEVGKKRGCGQPFCFLMCIVQMKKKSGMYFAQIIQSLNKYFLKHRLHVRH